MYGQFHVDICSSFCVFEKVHQGHFSPPPPAVNYVLALACAGGGGDATPISFSEMAAETLGRLR